jgi:hypothetical protein
MHTKFWLENMGGKNHLEGIGTDRIILKCILNKWDLGAWSGFIWCRIGASGWLL